MFLKSVSGVCVCDLRDVKVIYPEYGYDGPPVRGEWSLPTQLFWLVAQSTGGRNRGVIMGHKQRHTDNTAHTRGKQLRPSWIQRRNGLGFGHLPGLPPHTHTRTHEYTWLWVSARFFSGTSRRNSHAWVLAQFGDSGKL